MAIATEYILKALQIIDVEIELHNLRLNHPKQIVSSHSQQKSSLICGDKFSKRCLIELLAALFYIGAIVDDKGDAVDFMTLVRAFESFFNIDLKYAHNERKSLMTRSSKATYFLEMMITKLRKVITEKSQN